MTSLQRSMAAIVCAVVLLSGCREQTPPVAVIPRTTSTLLWEPMHMGIAEGARSSGMHVYWNAPADEGDTTKQLQLVTSSIQGGFRGVIFAPDETLLYRSIVQQAIDRKVPVVVVDDELGPAGGPLLSYVSTDEEAGAQLAAERLAKMLRGRGSIAVIGISSRLESGLTREAAFERALRTVAPGIEIKTRQFGDTVITHQQQIAMQIIEEHEPVDAIVALSSTATRGAYYARIASHQRRAVAIIGFDQDVLVPIQLGEVDSVVVQDTLTIGQVAMRNLEAEIRGDAVAERTAVAPLLITRDNVMSPEAKRLWSFTKYDWSAQ